MPAVMTTGPRVHVERSALVTRDFQNVGMTRDREVSPRSLPRDVCHEDGYAFALPLEILRHFVAYVLSVDVTVHAAERPERAQALQQVERSEVARVPDLV